MVVARTGEPNLRAYIATTFRRGRREGGERRKEGEEGKREGKRGRGRGTGAGGEGGTGDRAKGEEYAGTNTPTLRRARISSRALDLITKVTRCSTTALEGIKSCRSTAPPSSSRVARGNTAYTSAAINAPSVTAMIPARLPVSHPSETIGDAP